MKLPAKLIGNAGIYLGANVLNAGIPLLLMPILTRVLSPADYGTIAMFSIVLSVFGAFTGLSVHGAVSVRYFQLDKQALAQYIGACVAILLASTTTVLFLVVLLDHILVDLTGVPADWLLVAVVLSSFQFLGNIRLALWQASGAASSYGKYQVCQSLLNAGLSLALILIVGMAWEGRVIAQSIALTLFGLIAVSLLWREGFLRWPAKWKIPTVDALKFGVPLIPHALGALLIVAVDRFVIVNMLDIAQAGIYMVALQLGQVIGLFTESFSKAYAPWLMEKLAQDSDAVRQKIVRGTYAYFVFVPMAALAAGMAARWVLPFFVGKDFQEADSLVIYMALGFAFGGCYYMVTNYIFFQSKTKLLALVTFSAGLINIPLMIYLIRDNGLVGASQAFMLTQLLSFLGTWVLAHKVYPMPWLRLISGKGCKR